MSVRGFTLGLVVIAAGISPAAVDTAGAQDTSDLVYQVQALLEEVRELRGMVESQEREIENLRRRQRDQYLDLDQRLQSLEQDSNASSEATDERRETEAPVRPAAADPPPERGPADVPEVRAPIEAQPEVTPLPEPSAEDARELDTPSDAEQAAYDRAFRALRETRYADAAEGFSSFLDEYPDSSYAPNALYWLSETYYVTRDFETSLRFFEELLDRYPESSKQGDALLKLGFSHYELENWNEARAALEQVRSEYSGTTLARLAESRLRDMRLAGHY